MSETTPQKKGGIGNIIGGFVAGLYSVPEGIGYASLAGLNPMLGIYSGMVPVADPHLGASIDAGRQCGRDLLLELEGARS